MCKTTIYNQQLNWKYNQQQLHPSANKNFSFYRQPDVYHAYYCCVDSRSIFFSSGCILIVNLPKVASYALWLARGIIWATQSILSLPKLQHPAAAWINKHSTRTGRIDLEPSQATAAKHWSPHSVRVRFRVRVKVTVRVRVRVGWSAVGTAANPPVTIHYQGKSNHASKYFLLKMVGRADTSESWLSEKGVKSNWMLLVGMFAIVEQDMARFPRSNKNTWLRLWNTILATWNLCGHKAHCIHMYYNCNTAININVDRLYRSQGNLRHI